MTEEPNRCPECNGKGMPIIYGYVPPLGPGGERPEILKERDRGELLTGGCVVDSGSPAWYCKKCDLSFGEHDDVDVVEAVVGPDGDISQLD